MRIIGIHDGHNSSVSLSVNGEIVCAIQEERFTKRKNEQGFPKNALSYILDEYNLNNDNIDIVAMSTIERVDINYIKYPINTLFDVKDHIDMMNNYWKYKLSGKGYEKDYIKKVFEKKFNNEVAFYDIPDDYYNLNSDELQRKITDIVVSSVSDFICVDRDKIKFYDHHTCHIMYGYFSNPNKKNRTIGITVDSYGDGRNQTVWKIENNKFELIESSSECDLARLYKMVTLHLKMKPLEHEFKVMGMSPYAKNKYAIQVKEVFEELLEFNGLKIIHKNRPNNLYEFLNKELQYFRFDNIAGGIQLYTESMLSKLFIKASDQLGINNFVFSGGLAMNVKANKILGELDCVKDLFVAGSSSDESESIGACYCANYENGIKNLPLNNLYLGTSNKESIVLSYIKKEKLYNKFDVSKATNKKIASLLAEGEVVARVDGRMEFGSRALGNRSILANPSNPNVIMQINELIKGRDFWMPFAATILDTHSEKYLNNPKNFESRFMAIAMDTHKEFLSEIKAGTHPYDETIRPQILTEDQNKEYYNLLKEFEQLTGIGALLNTSYNLHGLPVVNDVRDALHVFENSGIKFLALGNILLSKI